MGGSGGRGGGFSAGGFRNPEELVKSVKQVQGQQEFELAVSTEIASLLAAFNDRKTELIQTHLDAIKVALNKEIEDAVDLRFAGSVAKHTFIDGFSDIDALVLLNGTELEKSPPSAVRAYFLERLEERFPKTEIRPGSLAVTVTFSDMEIQLLPAIRSGGSVLIADERSDKWMRTQPLSFSRSLVTANDRLGGKLVPTIKLAKAAMIALPPERRLTGYHTEALAIKLFQDYSGPQNTKAMVQHFFATAPRAVESQRLRDPTGQSQYLDDYLGAPNSLQRKLAADSIDRISRKLRNADAAQSVEMWRSVLDVPFGDNK
jgi:hypothetical protein